MTAEAATATVDSAGITAPDKPEVAATTAPSGSQPAQNTAATAANPNPSKPAVAAETKPAPAWPEDWVKQVAGNDDKKAQRIARYASPQAMAEALIEAQDKIRSGGLKVPFPADGDDAAKQRWRAENGVPESPDKYEIKLDNDMVIGEGDKQMFQEFLKSAHEENLPPSAVNKLASWYFAKQEAAFAEQAKADDTVMRQAKNDLMQEWGGGYTANLEEIKNHMVSQYGEQFANDLFTARLPDGRLLGNVPEFARSMLKQARELNPGAVLVPGASNQVAAVGDRIQQINTILRENPDAYFRDPKLQEEFGRLLEYQKKQNSQG